VDSDGSGYGPATFSFVRVKALGSYKCLKIFWWLSSHNDYSSRWKFFHDVNCTRVHRFTLLQLSSLHLLAYSCCSLRYICVCEKNTLTNSKDKFVLASVNCDSIRLCWRNISWGFGSQEIATESYVNVSTGYAAGYSGLFRDVTSKICHW